MVTVIKGVVEGIGLQALAAEWGDDVKVVSMRDSSAAMGVVSRKGVGKLRYMDVGKLWIQDLRETGKAKVNKVQV